MNKKSFQDLLERLNTNKLKTNKFGKSILEELFGDFPLVGSINRCTTEDRGTTTEEIFPNFGDLGGVLNQLVSDRETLSGVGESPMSYTGGSLESDVASQSPLYTLIQQLLIGNSRPVSRVWGGNK